MGKLRRNDIRRADHARGNITTLAIARIRMLAGDCARFSNWQTKGARSACFAAAAGGATQASAGRRSATTTSRRTAATAWGSVWSAVSRHSSSRGRHGRRGGCRSLTSIKQIICFMRLICASTSRRYRVPRLACKLTPVTTPSRGIPCELLLSLLRCCFVRHCSRKA